MSCRRLFLLIGAELAIASGAIASEAEHEHAGGIPFGSLAFSTINLLIFLWILGRFVMPAVRRWVADRRDAVVKALDDAARAKAEAEKLRAEWEARLAAVERTIEEMRGQARQDAERERQRILAAAHATAEAIRRDAERVAAYEVRRTQQQLRAELVKQAVHLAEDTVHTQWSAADQQRSVADFIGQVEK
jgi:F-type H+-transporting ATPase subunit b